MNYHITGDIEMIGQPLVSVITPCYNGEKYVYRFLDSILAQTYGNIELIFVNDGSTDATEDIVLSYKNRFEQKAIRFIYIYQENMGLGGAINTGLRNVHGKYLCWPDSDDYLETASIEKRVSILEQFTDYAVVTSDAYIRDSKSMDVPLGIVSNKNHNRFLSDQFELLLTGESIFCSGCHMVRTDCFLDTHHNAQIFDARRGQNWQMLLPVYYKYKRYFLDEPLYNYVQYHNTMSHGDDTKVKKIHRCDEHMEILLNTINRIDMPAADKNKYVDIVKITYARKKMHIAYDYGDKLLLKTQYFILKSGNQLTLKDMLVKSAANYKYIHYLVDVLRVFKRFRTISLPQ